MTCAFAAQNGKLTGSLRNDALTLDEHQVAFLKPVNTIETVLAEQPDEDADEDLEANRKWAARLSVTLRAAVARLRAHQWPAATGESVDGLVAELEAAREHWARAAVAGDADAFWEHYDPGFDALTPDLGAKARGALGLRDARPGKQGGPSVGGATPTATATATSTAVVPSTGSGTAA
ncbi:hypothetical protein [Streptomyces sp. NPDC050856]|uniref:hypothetical protein n=1 Tax=Streptomyces sp. NPDC050856 TaxID=3154939 RepID=UPI003402DBEE